MEKKLLIEQKLEKKCNTAIDVAIQYFTIISAFNALKLPEREIQLLAFTAVKGNISSGGKKDEFATMFGSSTASVGNMIHKLKKKKLLQKVDGKLKVHPALQLDFNGHIRLQLNIHAEG